ncbi:MAG: outer membrane beta-barrel family protein [Muribaculaceae bacterium]|nr:outer membrane beta-barrel family protein [Muribaculaceae bacterium]
MEYRLQDMKNVYVFISICLCAFSAMAQKNVSQDSLKTKELSEVVVEARTQRVIERGVEYIPTKKVKKTAIDATQLLELMNIPQLDITPGSMSVKTYAGKEVAMFIDYKAATVEDLQGLRPEDVLRVEVLQYPDDPRFEGQANVVNFIMRKYEWGGYTKLSAVGNSLNIDRGEGILYSKFVKGNWTFDANATGSITQSDNFCGYDVETFRDISVGNSHYDEVIRTTQSGEHYLRQSNTQSVSFRASYETKTTEIIHSGSYSRTGNPHTRNFSEVNYSEDVFSASSALSNESGQTISPRLKGYYYFSLPKNNSLIASWSFTYGSTRRNSSYLLGDMSPIINNNKETSYAPVVIVQYSKKFSNNNTFRTSLMSYNTIYHTYYEGSYNGLQKLLSSENMMFLEYLQNWQCGLSLYSRLGVSYVIGRLNGVNTLEQWNPRLGLQLQYKINDNNSASIEGWWGNNHPTPASSNSAIVQSDELLWLQGNPELRNTTFTTASASYTYMPTKKFNLSTTAEYHGYLNKTAYQYFSSNGYDGLIRREINSGDFFDFSGYVSATVKLLKNSLSLRASGRIAHLKSTGIDAQSMNIVTAHLQANYYFRNFSFILYYQTPNKALAPFDNGVRIHYKSTYGFLSNYSVGDFKLGLQFRNWFNKYKYYSDFDSERYSSHGWQWSSDLSRSVQLTLSYTLPYGKKVNRNNEIQTSIESNSAILK